MRVSFVSSRGSIYLRDAMTAEWKERVVALPQEGALCVPRPVYPSVCPVPTVNLKTESHTTFKLRAEVTHISSIWQSNFDVKRSELKVKVTGNVKIIFGAYICEKYVNSCKLRPG